MGMRIKAYCGQFGWSAYCVGKDLGGNKSTAYMDIQFRRGYEPKESGLTIDITDGFMTAYDSKKGARPKMIILEWKESEGKKQAEPKSNEVVIGPDDLPWE